MDEITERQAAEKKSKRKRNLVSWALLSPYLLIFLGFSIIPCIMGFVFSFMKYNPYMPATNSFNGFKNYINLFNTSIHQSNEFWSSFSTMLLFDLVMVPTLIIIPLTLAYFINMHPPGYKFFRAVIYLPSVISVTVMGIIFNRMFAGSDKGFINSLFGTNIQWLSGEPFKDDFLRWLVIFIASVWWQTGTNFVIFSGALRDVPKSLYEACEMDGGNRFRKILHVMLPSIKSSIAICLFNTLIGYLGLYGQPYVLHDTSNADLIVSPMMFIQKYLRGTGGGGALNNARITGFICSAAVVFGLITMAFGSIERWAMAERKRVDKRVSQYKLNESDKKLGEQLKSTAVKEGEQYAKDNV